MSEIHNINPSFKRSLGGEQSLELSYTESSKIYHKVPKIVSLSKFCTNCGKKYKDNESKFCGDCGAKRKTINC